MGVSVRRLLAAGVSTLAFGVAAGAAYAGAAPAGAAVTVAADANELDQVIVTGTRVTGLRAVDSPAPIQVLDSSALQRVGQSDLIQAIAQNVPSFNAQAFGGDAANLTLSAKLRGLSPNHALVLINGKAPSRHGQPGGAVGRVSGGRDGRPELHPAGRRRPHRSPAGRGRGAVRHRRHRRGDQHHPEGGRRRRIDRRLGRQVHERRRPDRRPDDQRRGWRRSRTPM